MKKIFSIAVALVVLAAMQACNKQENDEEEPVSVGSTAVSAQPLPGIFTVGVGPDGVLGTGDDVRVRFAPGNLQYYSSGRKWCFAAEQFLSVESIAAKGFTESANAIADPDLRPAQKKPIDLFGWGATGLETKYPKPYSIETTGYPQMSYLAVSVRNDWGACFRGQGWRTLTADEWKFLLNSYFTTIASVFNESFFSRDAFW